jgi:drug/metabolite transporter (DMT)-like permease
MKNESAKKLALFVILFFVAGNLFIFAQPSIQSVATQTSTWGSQVKIILTWLLSLAAAAGGVVIAFKLFSGKPDAREGIMMWVGGVLFCAAVALAINLL